MAKKHPKDCVCTLCSSQKEFSPSEHLLTKMAAGEVVLFAGAGISTENPTYCQSTFYDEVRAELKRSDTPSFPDLMTAYCELPDGRIRLLEKIKKGSTTFCHSTTFIAQWPVFIDPLRRCL